MRSPLTLNPSIHAESTPTCPASTFSFLLYAPNTDDFGESLSLVASYDLPFSFNPPPPLHHKRSSSGLDVDELPAGVKRHLTPLGLGSSNQLAQQVRFLFFTPPILTTLASLYHYSRFLRLTVFLQPTSASPQINTSQPQTILFWPRRR